MVKQAAARAAVVNRVSPANTDLSGRATISTTKNGHTVTNDASSVAAQKPWAAAVNKRIGIRSEVIKGAREALGAHAGGHKELAQLESDLTALNLDRPKARALVESVVQRLPIEKQAKVKAALDIPALWSTYHP
jgi:hypothetical protein